MSMSEQAISLFAAKNGHLKNIKVEDVQAFEKALLKFVKENGKEVYDVIANDKIISDDTTLKLNELCDQAVKQYSLLHGE